jgi:transposase-like protein
MEVAGASRQSRGPSCQHTDGMKPGSTAPGKQRYRWKQSGCPSPPGLVESRHHGRLPDVKQQLLDMTLKGRGRRDLARVLHSSPPRDGRVTNKRRRCNPSTIGPSNTWSHTRSACRSTKWQKRKSMKWGVLLGRKRHHAGAGLPWIIALAWSWRRCWGHRRTTSSDR